MKRLIILVIVLAALGGTAWAVGAMLSETAARRWLEARESDGWVSHAQAVDVGGYPTQFVTEFQGVELADPETGLAWFVPSFQLQQDIWRLDRIRAELPGDQVIASPIERLTLTGLPTIAELDVQPANRFALDALNADLGPLTITSSAGWLTHFEQGTLRVSRQVDTEASYHIRALAHTMTPPEMWRERLDPAGLLPAVISQVRANLTAVFDAPWNMDAIERARPQVTHLEIEEINAEWGDMLFRASGTLDVTAGGVPEGELAVRAENWEAMMDLAVNAGIVPEQMQTTAEAMMRVLAGMSGRPENIDATLSFSNGRVFLGPLPLGPAPNLRLR